MISVKHLTKYYGDHLAVDDVSFEIESGRVYGFDHPEHVALKAAGIDWQLWILVIWLIGFIGLTVWMVRVNRSLYRDLRLKRRKFEGASPEFVTIPIYTVNDLDSPCYFGYYGDEGIYLPSHVTEDEVSLRHSLAHEMGHVLQNDRRWGELRCSLVCMFWTNPLVWLAAVLSKRDAELSCDEIAVGLLGENERYAYGRTLVGLISRQSRIQDLFSAATTMTEGPKAIKQRIQILAKNPKRTVPMVIGFVMLTAVLLACTFTSGMETKNHEIDLSAFDNTRNLDPADDHGMVVEPIGQWGNYYRFLLKNVELDMDKHRLEISVFADQDAKTWLGDGTPQESYMYHKNEDGTVTIDFWNTEGAKSIGIVKKEVDGIVLDEVFAAIENSDPVNYYTIDQNLIGVNETSIAALEMQVYSNAMLLTVQGETPDDAEFHKYNRILLKFPGADERSQWIDSVLCAARGDGRWELLYIFEENIDSEIQVEAFVGRNKMDAEDYVVNEVK